MLLGVMKKLLQHMIEFCPYSKTFQMPTTTEVWCYSEWVVWETRLLPSTKRLPFNLTSQRR